MKAQDFILYNDGKIGVQLQARIRKETKNNCPVKVQQVLRKWWLTKIYPINLFLRLKTVSTTATGQL